MKRYSSNSWWIPAMDEDTEGAYVLREDAMKRIEAKYDRFLIASGKLEKANKRIKEYKSECSRLSHEVGFEKQRANSKDAHIK